LLANGKIGFGIMNLSLLIS